MHHWLDSSPLTIFQFCEVCLKKNVASKLLRFFFPKARVYKNFRNKFALSAFAYIKKMNMLSFSLITCPIFYTTLN